MPQTRVWIWCESETLPERPQDVVSGQVDYLHKVWDIGSASITLEACGTVCTRAKSESGCAFGAFHTRDRGAASQFSSNPSTVLVLQQSIEQSLRKLGTDYVDILFLHAAPASVLDHDYLLEAMGRLVDAGKVRIAGLSAEPDVVEIAMGRQTQPLRAMQFPCNVFNISGAARFAQRTAGDYVWVANHPYGGVARVQRCREVLRTLVEKHELDAVLCEKLGVMEDAVLADVVLNVILRGSGVQVVIPAMMRVEHVRANVQAVVRSRFDSREIAQIRQALATTIE